MMYMAMTLQEFLIWERVYAQFSLSPQVQCQNDGNVWNTNNSNTNGACFQNCPNGYVQVWNKDIDQCLIWPLTQADSQIQCEQNSNKKRSTYTNTCIDKCPNGYVQSWGIDTNECLVNGTDNLGINCDATQLINGTCSRNINKTLGVRQSDTTPNPTVLLQDIVLAATSFVGTLIMIALIVMGVKYVKWWYDESSTGDLKGNIRKLLIWLFLVIGSYTIIRLIQYVARGY